MERKEYLSIKFKKDFLKYSLLQEDSRSVDEIVDGLYKHIGFKEIIWECKRKIELLNDAYLSSDKLVVDGQLSEVLGNDMELDIQDKIIAEFKDYLSLMMPKSYQDALLASILREIEKQAWKNGIGRMALAVDGLIGRMKELADYYAGREISYYDEERMKCLYDKAKENTLVERIKRSNIEDIKEYRIALRENVEMKCQAAVNEAVAAVLNDVLSEDIFKRLKDNFNCLVAYSVKMKAELPELPVNPQWDEEYNTLVPTDFYYRNVADITAEQAFHMVLFMLFAKNEEWMRENGLLVDGELRVFTGDGQVDITEVVDKASHCVLLFQNV